MNGKKANVRSWSFFFQSPKAKKIKSFTPRNFCELCELWKRVHFYFYIKESITYTYANKLRYYNLLGLNTTLPVNLPLAKSSRYCGKELKSAT